MNRTHPPPTHHIVHTASLARHHRDLKLRWLQIGLALGMAFILTLGLGAYAVALRLGWHFMVY